MALQITGQSQGLLNASQKSGTPAAVNTGWHNELLKSDLLPKYAYLVLNGFVYAIQTASAGVATPTGAYPIGAAGTPLVAIYNPPNSQKNAIILQTNVSVRNCGTTLGLGSFGFSGGPTAGITAAASSYLNLLSLTGTGSSMKPYAATALTGSTAGVAIRPIWGTGYNASTATTVVPNGYTEDTAGSIIIAPGNFVAVTCSVTGGTASVVDASLTWAELPI